MEVVRVDEIELPCGVPQRRFLVSGPISSHRDVLHLPQLPMLYEPLNKTSPLIASCKKCQLDAPSTFIVTVDYPLPA